MNKQRTIAIRVLEWLFIAVYALYFLFVGYQLVLERPTPPVSTIPVLSVSLVEADAKALEGRVVLPAGSQYTATASGVFGKSEPFN